MLSVLSTDCNKDRPLIEPLNTIADDLSYRTSRKKLDIFK